MCARSLISPSYKGTIRKIMGGGGAGGACEVRKKILQGIIAPPPQKKKINAHRVALKNIHVLTFKTKIEI